MDRGAWQAKVHGLARVKQDFATEQHILLRLVRTNVTTGSYIQKGISYDSSVFSSLWSLWVDHL